MTTKMSSQPPAVMFKTNFGFRGSGLRNPLFTGSNPVQGVQYSSLPCHVQGDLCDNENNYESLKYEGEQQSSKKRGKEDKLTSESDHQRSFVAGPRKPSRMTFQTRDVVTVNGRDTNNNG